VVCFRSAELQRTGRLADNRRHRRPRRHRLDSPRAADWPGGLTNYTYGISAALQAGVGTGGIRVTRTHAYNAHGEIEYRTNLKGRHLHSLVYIVPTRTGYASATFAAPTTTYAYDVGRVERYLKTLTGR
jgi:hypothetical protein